MIVPHGKAALLGELLHRNGYGFSFTAPVAARLTIAWYVGTTKAKVVLAAKTTAVLHARTKTNVKLRLAAAGRKVIQRARRLKVTARATFTPRGKASVSADWTFLTKR